MGILCSEAFFLLVEVLSNLCHVLSLSLLSSASHVPTTTDLKVFSAHFCFLPVSFPQATPLAAQLGTLA